MIEHNIETAVELIHYSAVSEPTTGARPSDNRVMPVSALHLEQARNTSRIVQHPGTVPAAAVRPAQQALHVAFDDIHLVNGKQQASDNVDVEPVTVSLLCTYRTRKAEREGVPCHAPDG